MHKGLLASALGSCSRRSFLLAAALGLVAPRMAGAASRSQKGDKLWEGLELWYERAAGPWVEALPVGNGRLGAMVFGRPLQERIQLNEDTLYAGSPYDPNNPEALAALPKVRELIDAERFQEASDLISKSVMAKPIRQMPYGAAGDLLIDFRGLSSATAYRRSLDLDSAIASTEFKDSRARYLREVFASAPDNVVVVRLVAEGGGAIDFDLGYRHPRNVKYGVENYNGEAGEVLATGAPWNHREALEEQGRPAELVIAPDGTDSLLIRGRNVSAEGIPAGLGYAVRVKVISDGEVASDGDRLSVRGAKSATLLVAAATSYVNFADTSGDPVAAVRRASDAAAAKRFEQLRADHLAAHRALFRRMSISLGGNASADLPTDKRIAAVPQRPDAGLAALYAQFARYLLISSSRPGSQPANLQGIWNEGTNPPWGGKYTININTEMNYWPADPANLGECIEPVLRMIEDLAVTGARSARVMYGARGWVAHHNTDLWRASAPIDGPLWGIWPTGGAWMCKTLWDHYEYHPDPAFLARIYPLLKGASLFFLDTLVEDPKGRGLVTSPSISPENQHRKDIAIASGPAMDQQILRDLFAYTLAAQSELGGPDPEFAAEVERVRRRLPPDKIGAQGQLQEWLEDWDAGAPEQNHRHVSHLYAVYPSEQINVRDTPELVRAAKVTLDRRGDMSTGWATAWRLALWARMGEGERAYSILQGLLGPVRTYPNMFDSHPPFQIDGNFGGTAGILEMLVQSWGGEVHLLPALPAAWPTGSLHGVRARGGIELDLDWKAGRIERLRLRGRPNQNVSLRYRGKQSSVKLDRAGTADVRAGALS